MSYFQTRPDPPVLGISNKAWYRNEGNTRLVCQREEVIVTPENIRSSDEALDPALSITGLDYTSPTHFTEYSKSEPNQFIDWGEQMRGDSQILSQRNNFLYDFLGG